MNVGGQAKNLPHLDLAEQVLARLVERIPALDAYDEEEMAALESQVANIALDLLRPACPTNQPDKPVVGEAVALRWRKLPEAPRPGHKIVALFDDGSGACLYFVHDGGVISSEGDEYSALGSCDWWAYLPDGYEFWCEGLTDELVVTLPEHKNPDAQPPITEDKVSGLVKALEWYANPEIYKPHPHGLAFDDRDLSWKAQSVLASFKQEGRR